MAHPNGKFRASFYVAAYRLARDGLSDKQVAKALGVAGNTLRTWCARRPALKEALAEARDNRDHLDTTTFHEYIFNHLSPKLQDLWNAINECENLTNGVERIDALFRGHGIRARQHLFLYALTQSLFNTSAALRKLAIPRKTFEGWCANDPVFAEMVDEIHWHKNNFFEQAFMGRVAAGDTSAIIHAVKTRCRARGYNERIEVEHTGTIQHEHTVSVADLDLPLDTRREILKALRAHQAATPGAVPGNRLLSTSGAN